MEIDERRPEKELPFISAVFTDTGRNVLGAAFVERQANRLCDIFSTTDFAGCIVDDDIFTFHESHDFI